MHSQVLAVICSRNAQGPGELQFRQIVAVQTGDVLIIRARQGLLGLHDFDAVRDTRAETFLGARKILIGKFDILTRDFDLLLCSMQIKKCGADVVIDLAAKVLGFGPALKESGFRLRDVALDASTSENRYGHSALKSERAV